MPIKITSEKKNTGVAMAEFATPNPLRPKEEVYNDHHIENMEVGKRNGQVQVIGNLAL
eukprot:CAMPEP_0170645998 /NCGR_PEP_ID=MMETSP0224-20130122/43392_1 /TAXON_ID=285029 /ORGANISM="Togula jolla, Strain CCCM 725" /LENGTH=57 /DNA_ID=CAMNT_0010977279 /DNA_START=278 /DNA_END=451 /DNA_ORIENTATION=+